MKGPISSALCALAPGAQWVLFNEDYSTLQWLSSGITIPTLDQVNTWIAAQGS